jgi:hypothetical protein
MISEFIERQLAEVDDLAELKATLVALRLLEQKVSPTASVTERELMAHPAIRDGLSFPAISLRPALQRAVARGTLLSVELSDEPRYFANDEANRKVIEAMHALSAPSAGATRLDDALSAVTREIERLEMIDVYAVSDAGRGMVEEWLMRGYSQAEIAAATQLTLKSPRAKHLPPRGIAEIDTTLTQSPPAEPTEYFAVVVAKTSRTPEDIVNLRERLGRWPTAHEFNLVRGAVSLFGLRAAVEGLKRVSRAHRMNVDALIPLLAEQEEAALAAQRDEAQADVRLRELIQLYESSLGMPPTGAIADEMRSLLKEAGDLVLWRAIFAYAVAQNKRSWAYIRKLVQNPSPDVFVPQPANDAAQLAYDEYRRRVNRVLDASIATEINQLAQKISDAAIWKTAFDRAAAANALRWDYIKKVLTASQGASAGKNHGRAKSIPKRGASTTRKPQVEYDEQARAAAETRARQRLAKRPDGK